MWCEAAYTVSTSKASSCRPACLPVALAHAHSIVVIADRILNLPVVRAKAKQLGIDLPEPSNASGSHANSSSAVQAPKYHQGVPGRSHVLAYECGMHAMQL